MKVLLNSFNLNGHTLGFHLQTRKVQPVYLLKVWLWELINNGEFEVRLKYLSSRIQGNWDNVLDTWHGSFRVDNFQIILACCLHCASTNWIDFAWSLRKHSRSGSNQAILAFIVRAWKLLNRQQPFAWNYNIGNRISEADKITIMLTKQFMMFDPRV